MGVKYSNFHTTALCSPTRSSLLTGRNATSNGMATIAEFGSGFPASPRGSRSRTGSSPRCWLSRGTTPTRRQVAPDTGEETTCPPARAVGRSVADSSASTGSSVARRTSWYPDLIYDNHPIDPPATPEEGYHLAKDLSDKAIQFIPDAKVVEPDKPFFMYFSPQAPRSSPRVHRSRPTATRVFRRGLRGDPRRDPRPPEASSACCPRTPSCPPINPHGEPAHRA